MTYIVAGLLQIVETKAQGAGSVAETTYTHVVDTLHTRIVDTTAVVLPAPTSKWLFAFQALAALATLATIPAAIAAWKAASSARDAANAAAQQARISDEQWKAQREAAATSQRGIDVRLAHFAGDVHQRVDRLCLEDASVRQANNRRMGWLRGFDEEMRRLEPTMRELVMSAEGASEDRQELAREAARKFANAVAAIGVVVRLTAELTTTHEPQGSQSVLLGLTGYPENLQACETVLGKLAQPVAAQEGL